MPRGDKSKYTDKQKRMAEHIEESYKERGVSNEVAEQRAWATVNATDGGGKLPGGGEHGRPRKRKPAKTTGQTGTSAPRARKPEKS